MTKTTFPEPNLLSNTIDKDYREALSGKPCLVMDISIDNSGYLVLSKHKNHGDFLWHVEKEDTVAFLPIANINGNIVNCNNIQNPIDEIFEHAKELFPNEDIEAIKQLFKKIIKKGK